MHALLPMHAWSYGGKLLPPLPPSGPIEKSQCWPRMSRNAATVPLTVESSYACAPAQRLGACCSCKGKGTALACLPPSSPVPIRHDLQEGVSGIGHPGDTLVGKSPDM